MSNDLRDLKNASENQSKLMVAKYESHISELTSKLEAVSESNSSANKDLQRLLASQRVMSEKWKDESAQIREHYESMIKKFEFEIGQYQNRIAEMEIHSRRASAQRRELIDHTTAEKRQFAQLHDRFMEIEKQNSNLTRQVSNLVSKEVEMMEERKKLCRELDRIKIEKEQAKKDELKRSLRPKTRSAINELNEQDTAINSNSVVLANKTKQLEADIERIQKRTRNRRVELKHYEDDSDQ